MRHHELSVALNAQDESIAGKPPPPEKPPVQLAVTQGHVHDFDVILLIHEHGKRRREIQRTFESKSHCERRLDHPHVESLQLLG